jgi:hypothetical protein
VNDASSPAAPAGPAGPVAPLGPSAPSLEHDVKVSTAALNKKKATFFIEIVI